MRGVQDGKFLTDFILPTILCTCIRSKPPIFIDGHATPLISVWHSECVDRPVDFALWTGKMHLIRQSAFRKCLFFLSLPFIVLKSKQFRAMLIF